jgi:hypothetical protein
MSFWKILKQLYPVNKKSCPFETAFLNKYGYKLSYCNAFKFGYFKIRIDAFKIITYAFA